MAELEANYAAEFVADRARAEIVRDQLQHAQAALERVRQRAQGLVVAASTRGRFTAPLANDMPGRYLQQGNVIGYVLASVVASVLASVLASVPEPVSDVAVLVGASPLLLLASPLLLATLLAVLVDLGETGAPVVVGVRGRGATPGTVTVVGADVVVLRTAVGEVLALDEAAFEDSRRDKRDGTGQREGEAQLRAFRSGVRRGHGRPFAGSRPRSRGGPALQRSGPPPSPGRSLHAGRLEFRGWADEMGDSAGDYREPRLFPF